jgi:hypothetical protein
MRPEFEGFQPSDFMNTAARTTWHGRNQLGGAVAYYFFYFGSNQQIE